MISTTLVPGRQNIALAIAAPNSQTMMSAWAKVRTCWSNGSLSGWMATKPRVFSASIIAARLVRLRLLVSPRQMRTRSGVCVAGACLRTFDRIRANASRCCGCAFWQLTPLSRLLTIACSRKTGRGAISRMSPAGTSSLSISARCQGLQRPGQHRDAHRRALMDERRDVEHVMAEVRFLRTGDQEMLPG